MEHNVNLLTEKEIRNMKRVFSIIGILAVSALVFSCSKSNTTPQTPAEEGKTISIQDLDPSVYLLSFSGSFESAKDADETKVTINLTDGAQAFETGDEVMVYVPATSTKGIYAYDEADQDFKPKNAEQAVAIGANYAYVYYPAAEFDLADGKVNFTMPEAVTELPGKKTPIAGIIPAGARVDGKPAASFKNLGSILRFSFTAANEKGETLTAVELSGEGTAITGKGEVSWTENTANGEPVLAALNGGKVVTVTLGTPVRLNNTETSDFFFFLPQSGEITNMKVKAIYGKKVGEVEYAPFEGFGRGTAMHLERGKLITVEKTLKGFFSGGDGSAASPYLIASADDFKAIATLANATAVEGGNGYDDTAARTFFGSAGVHYQQTANIDFEDADISASMIGGEAIPFAGTYDGNTMKLSNFSISGTINGGNEGVAPFKTVIGGTLKNIAVSGETLTGRKFAAGLVAYAKACVITGCSIENSSISSDVNYGAAGLVGGIYAESEQGESSVVTDCSATGITISATGTDKRYYGGLIDYINGVVTVSACSLNGTVTVNGEPTEFGGIVGQINNDNALITGCSNNTAISGIGNYAGGIVGRKSKGSIEGCTNGGSIGGAQYVGGIVGINQAGDIKGSTNKGAITAKSYAGGIAGQVTGGTIKDCTNESEGTLSVTGGYAGGIVGSITGGSITASDGKNTENKADIDLGIDEGKNCVGGIAGEIKSDVSNVKNSGVVSGYYNIGGIGGDMSQNGSVENALTSGDVSGYQNIGGLVGKYGHNANEAITKKISLKNCHVDGADISATATDGRAGGLAGLARAGIWIEGCTAFRGTVSGHQDVGGAIGHFQYASSSTDKSNRPYVGANLVSMDVVGLDPIQGTARIGGFIGYFQNNKAVYTFFYQNGVVGGSIKAEGCQYVGSFVGYASSSDNKGRIWDSYSLIEDANFTVTATNAQIGGFAGGYDANVNFTRNYFVNSQNTMAQKDQAPADKDGIAKTTLAEIRTVKLVHDQGFESPSCNVNGSAYTTTTWSNPEDVNYPVPTILVTYGHYK